MSRRRWTARPGIRRFVHVTFPLLANLYLICTLLSTIWTLGDFNTIYFVTGGGPSLSTHVLATLGIRDAFEIDNPQLGMAAVMSALPLLIPLVVVLMRKLAKTQGATMSATMLPAAALPRRPGGHFASGRPGRGDRRLPGDPGLDPDAALHHGRGRAGGEATTCSAAPVARQPDTRPGSGPC